MPASFRKPALDQTGWTRAQFVAAALTALLVGIAGLYPHLRWSAELQRPAWFFNSYDEGFYGWLAVSEITPHRALSDLVMHGLYFLTGGSAERAMVLADFLLPAGAALACSYLVRPLFRSSLALAGATLFILTAAECLALRSRCIPHAFIYEFLQAKVVPLAGGPAGVLLIDNPTSTFWLFRTPEPQLSWIFLFATLGLAVRLVLRPAETPLHRGPFLVLATLTGMGYLFCALSAGGAFLLFAVFAAHRHRALALILGAGGLLCVTVCLGLSAYAARQSGGDSLVFPSHLPVVTLSVVFGGLAAGLLWLRRRKNELQPIHLLFIAFGLTPLCIANQQLLTGRMIYLLNFENFSLAQLGALALLACFSPAFRNPAASTAPGASWPGLTAAGTLALLTGGMLLHSQQLSYAQYLDTNRLAESYAATLRALGPQDEQVVCDDFFEIDTLALRLGRRPHYLIARDMIFSRAIGRLKNAETEPASSHEPRQALFGYLKFTSVTPEEFSRRFEAVTDPGNPSWQDRFLLGGFLYNHADFWATFTHGRDLRLDWIKQQKAGLVESYREFLREAESARPPIIFVLQRDKPAPDFLTRQAAQLLPASSQLTPVAMKAYRLAAVPAP